MVTDNADLLDLIRINIEEPAARQIQTLLQRGHITEADAERFSVSAYRYKETMLAEHEDLDPRVRQELRKALLTDYQNEVTRLLAALVSRTAAVAQSVTQPTNAASKPEDQKLVDETAAAPIRSGAAPSPGKRKLWKVIRDAARTLTHWSVTRIE